MNKDTCQCLERSKESGDGIRDKLPPIRYGDYHSCDYVRSRNLLIPEAERIADMTALRAEGDAASGNRWTRAFSMAMDKLYSEL